MKRIEDRDGNKYRLEDNRLFQPQPKEDLYGNAREVKRTELRKALKALNSSGMSGGINYYFSERLTPTGKLSKPDSSNVRLYVDGDRIGIGCCTFEDANGRALQHWARA